MMKMNVRCFYLLLTALLTAVHFLSMCDFNISTLNLNGTRSDFKQAALFKLMETKRIDVMFDQETHSTTDNYSCCAAMGRVRAIFGKFRQF